MDSHVFVLVRKKEWRQASVDIVGVYRKMFSAKNVANKMIAEDVDADEFRGHLKKYRKWESDKESASCSFHYDDVSYEYEIEKLEVNQ